MEKTIHVRIFEKDKKKIELLCKELERQYGGRFFICDAVQFMMRGNVEKVKKK